ncbi:(2Fe-2S)-binding protein [Streptomyces mangrovisoli]|uniref:(2Fe-2S)-binding protein n=1 Tax=Streptomyces mangrovisoli TaxID=1428628 RepID=UPI000A4FEB52|nr:(2Fe-2S)-binding protein [Streptomyces mangrovisoli]
MTRDRTPRLAVIGAGPAGLAAALAAAAGGVRVTLVDAAAQAGGQFHRQPAAALGARLPRALHHGRGTWQRLRGELSEQVAAGRITHLTDHHVWYVERESEDKGFTVHALLGPGQEEGVAVRADGVLLATGGYEKVLPFPGWTLPGVVTAGGAQALLKGGLVLPGRSAVVAGTGPLLLPVATALAAAGARVAALVESADPRAFLRHPGALAAEPAKLAEGAAYALRLLRHGVRVHTRHTVVAAHGADGGQLGAAPTGERLGDSGGDPDGERPTSSGSDPDREQPTSSRGGTDQERPSGGEGRRDGKRPPGGGDHRGGGDSRDGEHPAGGSSSAGGGRGFGGGPRPDRLTAVTVAALDDHGRVRPGTERRIPCDTLAVGHGLIPHTDLAGPLGCRLDGAAVQVDAEQRTSTPGVWAAGETTGVGGAELALAEGEIAGRSIAARLHGREPDPASWVAAARLRARQRRFAAALDDAYAPPAGWTEQVTDDTVVCRCEEVTAGAVRDAAALLGEVRDLRTVKLLTRAGMGWCQGRICRYGVAGVAGCEPAPGGIPFARPVPLGVLARHPAEEPPPGEEPAPAAAPADPGPPPDRAVPLAPDGPSARPPRGAGNCATSPHSPAHEERPEEGAP